MVKLGFIVEGATEKIILEKSGFFDYLRSNNIDFVPDVIDAQGNGNLLPHNIQSFTGILKDKGATKIVILTDQDNDKCITLTKQRIDASPDHVVVIAVKAFEAWFLADTIAMRAFLENDSFESQQPEIWHVPFNVIQDLRMRYIGRGIADKKILANKMARLGFSIERAAMHPQCNSAKYFINKIISMPVQ